jgi:GT2 family glycosyltransferase
VVLCDKPGVRLLTNAFCRPRFWMPLYAQNTLLHRPHAVPRDIDVLYIGNLNLSHRAERGYWLQQLARLSARRRVVITTDVWGEEYARLQSRARIVFNHSVRGEVNLRVFETMACGALAFLESDNEEVRDYFRDGEELVLYDRENFLGRIEHYLNHPEEAEAIARRGQARAAAFSGEARFDALVEYILAQPRSGRPFLQLPEGERRLQDFLMVCVSQRLEYGPLERRLGADLAAQYPEDARAWSALGRSLLFFRHRSEAGHAGEGVSAFKRALKLDSGSAVHALNAATAARMTGNARLEELCLRVALKAERATPAGWLWGVWSNAYWTRWIRALAVGEASLSMLHAEAEHRLAVLASGRGERGEVIALWEAARARDAGNVEVAQPLAEVLWEAGEGQRAVQVLLEHLPQEPLNVPFRVNLAERCAALGFGARARQLVEEAQDIRRALRLPWQPRAEVRGHAARREGAGEGLALAQEARLRADAEARGRFRPLLAYLAARGDRAGMEALAGRIPEGDRLPWLLLLGRGDDRSLSRGVFATQDPWLYYTMAKRALGRGDHPLAEAVGEAALDAMPEDTTTPNLLARFHAHSGRRDCRDVWIDRSLAVSATQSDLLDMREAESVEAPYLGVAPRLEAVSFYLPAYNVARYIGDTLSEVLLQSYPLHELLVINDGSTDESVAIAREFPAMILHHEENRGLAAARNTALAEASGAWVASVDTDACPDRDFLLHLMMELEQRDRRVSAVGGMLIEEYQEAPPDRWRARMMAQHHGVRRLHRPPFLFGSTLCVERAAALSAGGFDEAHRTNGEDTELCKALLRGGRAFVYTPHARARHLRRDDLHSVLRTWWNWHYWVKMEARAYDNVAGLVHALLHTLAQTGHALNRFLAAGEEDLLYLTSLLPFYDAFLDFGQGVRTGLLLPGEARTLRDRMFALLAAGDAAHGLSPGLWALMRRDTVRVTGEFDGAAPAPLGAGFEREWRRYAGELEKLLQGMPAAVWRRAVLCGGNQ